MPLLAKSIDWTLAKVPWASLPTGAAGAERVRIGTLAPVGDSTTPPELLTDARHWVLELFIRKVTRVTGGSVGNCRTSILSIPCLPLVWACCPPAPGAKVAPSISRVAISPARLCWKLILGRPPAVRTKKPSAVTWTFWTTVASADWVSGAEDSTDNLSPPGSEIEFWVPPRTGVGKSTVHSLGEIPRNFTCWGSRVNPSLSSTTILVVLLSNWPTRTDSIAPESGLLTEGLPRLVPGKSITNRVGLKISWAFGCTPPSVVI